MGWQLRFDGWVTELADMEAMKHVKSDLSNGKAAVPPPPPAPLPSQGANAAPVNSVVAVVGRLGG